MSAANVSASWQKEQSNRVAIYKPQRPAMPNDNRCATGDAVCNSRTPPPPPGSLNEGFSKQYPIEWIAVVAAAAVVFFVITVAV